MSVALFVGYLVLIVRSRLTDSGASCNCFGARRPVTSLTVVRNAWFLLLAVVSASVTWTTPLVGGPLVALGDTGWWLLAVKEGCGACTSVIAALPRWRPLLPELDIRLLLWPAPERSELTEYDEPQSLHDSHMYVSGSIEDWSTPTAVLLGADCYLAGGPVSGAAAIEEFVGDVYESLHGERPPTD